MIRKTLNSNGHFIVRQDNMQKKQVVIGRYIGYSSKGYHFITQDLLNICFDRCDKDIVNQFELLNSFSNNKRFEISYWELMEKNEYAISSIKIISDLKIVAGNSLNSKT